PLCRAPFSSAVRLTDPTVDPRSFFHLACVPEDRTGGGGGDPDAERSPETLALTERHAMGALTALLPVNPTSFDARLQKELWPAWVASSSSTASAEPAAAVLREPEFLRPGGMLEWLSSHLLERKVEGQRGQPPRLHDSPERWFQHFDFTNAGRLSKAEFLRGVAKAYDVSLLAAPSTPSRRKRGEGVHKLRELVDAVWDEVRWAEAVPLEDFTGRHGLAERLLAALPSDDLPHVGERLLSVDEEDGGRQPPLRLPFRKSVVQEAPALLSVDEALAKARVSDFETRKADEARALERAERVRAATQLEAPDQRVDGSSPPG
ncbi:unnamed protein product, partial [Polarella glacialis]